MRSSYGMSGYRLATAARALDEQAVAELHDVGLVDGRDLLPAEPARIVERELGDSRGRLLGDDLQTFDDARDDHVLEAGVQILGVLANDHEVHVLKPARDARQVGDRSQVRKEVERLPDLDVDAGEPATDRRRDRALERDVVPPNGLHDLDRAASCRFVPRLSGRRRDAPSRWSTPDAASTTDDGVRHLRPDAVAGDEGNRVRPRRHQCRSVASIHSRPTPAASVKAIEAGGHGVPFVRTPREPDCRPEGWRLTRTCSSAKPFDARA